MITRDMVQGFIDGLKASGGLEDAENKIKEWLKSHPRYPSSDAEIAMIIDDLGSYKK